MTDEEIMNVAKEHNRGDLAINIGVNQRRSEFQHRVAPANVLACEVINRSRPEANYQFCWCPFGDDQFFADCKDEGYKIVISGDWLCDRQAWAWDTPDKKRFRWSVSNMLVYRDMFLMYRDEELYQQQLRNREKFGESRITDRYETEAENAQRTSFNAGIEGLEVTATNSGKEFTAKGTKRRPTVI